MCRTPFKNVPLFNQIEMSPMRVMTESSHSLFSVEGVLLCRGFGQGRAPYLRAPEGSLDGTNGTAHNAERGNGWTPLWTPHGVRQRWRTNGFLLQCSDHNDNRVVEYVAVRRGELDGSLSKAA